MRPTLSGAKGASAPYEASDTLRSTQIAEIVDLLGEGPIGGLVNGLKSIYLDGVPVENADDTRNFAEFGYSLTLGSATSEADHGFADVQTEVGVGVTVLHAVPVVRTITDTTADAVRVTLTVPQLLEQRDNGDRVGSAFEFAIDIQSAGGGYVERLRDTITGKASAPYSRAVRLSLVEVGPAPWDVRVRRITADPASASIVNAFAWGSYTVISGVRMLYRHSAVARLSFDAKNFSSIPQRWYDVWGMNEWDIPVNYDPLARTVAGSWNGVFKQGPTNNPAWVLYNLVQHPRYGLGHYVAQLPDKWTLYQLQLWCDEQLPDGRGGTEPRYTINEVILEQREALQLLQEICSVFRGVLMHGGGSMTLTWDAPGEPVASYTPANVVDGLFTYADGSGADRKTSCTCWYTDRTQAGKRVPVTWDDEALVAAHGMRPMEIRPLGVATPAQALRMAKWALYTANLEAQTIAFRVGGEGPLRRLGEVFQVADPTESGERLGGRIHAATTTAVTLDAAVTLASGETYTLWVTQPHASDATRLVLESRTVTTAAGSAGTLTVSPAFSAAPLAGTVWLLEGTDVAPTLWRYVGITEVAGEGGKPEYDVLGVRHEPGKWALIEADQPLSPRPTRRLPFGAPPVGTITITEQVLFDALGVARIRATVSWPAPAAGLRYVVRWRVDNGLWHQELPISHNTVEGDNLAPGLYEVQVQSLNGLGQLSIPTTATAVLLGNLGVPNPTGFGSEIKPGQVVLSWNEPQPPLLFSSVLKVGATWATATLLWQGRGTDYKHARPPNGTYKVWLAHAVVKGDTTIESPVPVSIDVTVDDTIDQLGGGTLSLTTDRPAYFLFADATTHTSTSPVLTITCVPVGLVGTPTITAEAFDNVGASLGPVAMDGTGLIRTMSAAQFVAPGTLGSVRMVTVTAALQGAVDQLDVMRQDPSTAVPTLYLSNPVATVSTDEAGEFGDYTDAKTEAAVMSGIDNVSLIAWTFSIVPDAGITSTINGVAGPVPGAIPITVAVSDSDIDDGVVLVRAEQSFGGPTLEKAFRVRKNKAKGPGVQAVWEPRTEVRLPLTDAGAVASFTDAWSRLRLRQGGIDVTALWQITKAADVNVVSTLTGNRVDVTAVLALGTIGTPVGQAVSLPAGWTRPQSITWHGAGWVAWGYHASTPWSKVQTSPDFSAWTTVDVGTSGRWTDGASDGAGTVVGIETGVVGTNRIVVSHDHGATWSLGSLGASAQWYSATHIGKFMVCPQGTTAGRQSTDGDSWSALALPDTSCRLGGGVGRLVAMGSSGNLYLSTNGGASWGAAYTAFAFLSGGIYAVRQFMGRLVAARNASAPTSDIYYADEGLAFVRGSTAVSYSSPVFFGVVSGVLYLVGSDGAVQYTTDGKNWRSAGATTLTTQAQTAVWDENHDVPVALLPNVYSNSPMLYVRTPLAATSEVDGAVVLEYSRPGQAKGRATLPVLRGQTQGDLYAFFSGPAYLQLPATREGVVTDYSQATFTAGARKNGQDDTANFAWSWTAPDMTPGSGSTNVATFTGMSDSVDRAVITWTAHKAGVPDLVERQDIIKLKGTDTAGPLPGLAVHVAETVNTYVAVRFTTDGWVQVKRGSGGSFVNYLPWAGVIRSANSAKWMKLVLDGAAPTGWTGPTGWLAMTAARDFILSDSSSGTHVASFSVLFGDDSSGTNAVPGFGSLKLIVP